MAYKATYWGLISVITIGLGYVYFYRLEILFTLYFENALDDKIASIEIERSDLARAIVMFEADQRAEISLRSVAKSNSYSSPFRALSTMWYKVKIVMLNFMHFIFTYRIILYILFFVFILYMIRVIFWRYYAL